MGCGGRLTAKWLQTTCNEGISKKEVSLQVRETNAIHEYW